MLNKVPEIATVFSIPRIIVRVIVSATGAGGIAMHLGLGTAAAVAVMGAWLAAAPLLQICARCCVPRIYWLTVLLVSIIGTQITDRLTDGFGGSLYASTAAFAVTLAGRHLRDRVRGPTARSKTSAGVPATVDQVGETAVMANPTRKSIS